MVRCSIFVRKHSFCSSNAPFLTGGQRVDGVWTWRDATTMTTTAWSDHHPLEADVSNAIFAVLSTTGLMLSEDSGNPYVICEKQPGKGPSAQKAEKLKQLKD